MAKLTKAQNLARPIINFLVERYFPNSLFFYGSGPLMAFNRHDEERRSVVGSSAALSLARHAFEQKATRLSVEASGITINDEDIGDWRITVERTDALPLNTQVPHD